MIRKMNMEDSDFVGGVAFCFVLDYNNGRNLDWEEPDDWEWDPEDEYYDYDEDYDDHGCYVWLTKELYHITIKCPKNYKGLCIGIGGPSYFYDDTTDEKWMFGVAPFGHMRDYKKNPKNWHFMRIK